MSENIVSFPEDAASAQDSMAQVSAGAMLRRVREAQDLHIAALAVSLKVPVKKLEALEADRLDLLPDTVFARSLACSVCRVLKIDPNPILERLPHAAASSLKSDESGVNAPFRTSGGGHGLPMWEQFSRPLVLAVLVLLVGVVVLVFLPFTQRVKIASVSQSVPAAVISPPPAPVQAPAATENQRPEGAAVLVQLSEVASGSLPPRTVSSAAAALPGSVANAPPVLVPGSGATTGLLVLQAHGASWVEIVDASGVVQVRKTMANGEVIGASGVMPLSVVVGRVDVMDVRVRGQRFDLTRIAKDNIARFEVK